MGHAVEESIHHQAERGDEKNGDAEPDSPSLRAVTPVSPQLP